MEPFRTEAEALEAAYDQYAGMLYRLALTRLHQREDAEDIVQEVFLKYLASYRDFRSEEHERAWLVRVTLNACTDSLKRHGRRNNISLDEIPELGEEEPSDFLRFSLVPNDLLPEKLRLVIVLHYLEGYSVKEVSSMLGISLSACKMRLKRGRKLLADAIREEERHV